MTYRSSTTKEAVGYMAPHLRYLKDRGYNFTSLLDVGAAHGHFAHLFRSIWSNANVTAVECNQEDKYFLENTDFETHYACLGDKTCEKTFYIDKNSPVGGGSSFYKERTPFFKDANAENKEIVPADIAFKDRTFEFVKIDTQGSELEVIKGAADILTRTKFLLVELSFVKYNQGAPLIDDVLAETRKHGFRIIDTFGPTRGAHMWGSQRIQVDVLLAKDTEPVFDLAPIEPTGDLLERPSASRSQT